MIDRIIEKYPISLTAVDLIAAPDEMHRTILDQLPIWNNWKSRKTIITLGPSSNTYYLQWIVMTKETWINLAIKVPIPRHWIHMSTHLLITSSCTNKILPDNFISAHLFLKSGYQWLICISIHYLIYSMAMLRTIHLPILHLLMMMNIWQKSDDSLREWKRYIMH